MTSATITIQVENTKNDAMTCAATARQKVKDREMERIAKHIEKINEDIDVCSKAGQYRARGLFDKNKDNEFIVKSVILYFRKRGFSVVKDSGNACYLPIIIDWEYANE